MKANVGQFSAGSFFAKTKSKLSTTIKAKNSHHFYKIKERIKTPWIKMYSINCSSKF